MRKRFLVLAPLVGIVLASGASAAPTTVPQITDPAGDAVGGQAGTDITSVQYTTAGTGRGKRYTPKEFSVTMTLAGPPLAGPGVSYEVEATTDTCGTVLFTYEPGTPYEKLVGLSGWAMWDRCAATDGDGNIELLTPEVVGNKITWKFPLKSTGLKVGTVFGDFRARVDPSNPALPLPSDETGTALGLIDAGKGAGTWKLS